MGLRLSVPARTGTAGEVAATQTAMPGVPGPTGGNIGGTTCVRGI